MDEAAIEGKKLEPIKPTLDAITRITDGKSLARALGETVRADVDVLNATNLDTDNLFGLWVAQDLDEPGRSRPFLLQGGLEMPVGRCSSRPSRGWRRESARVQGPHRRHVEARRGSPSRRSAPPASWNLRRRWRRPTRAARRPGA